MIVWRWSSTRIFIINEYWIFIPSAILANYIIIRKIRLDKEKTKEFQRLVAQLEREKRIRRILLLSLGLNRSIHLLTRGGTLEFINVDYIQCGVDDGVSYLNDNRLKNIIHDLYRKKRKGKMIYITATALCHLANRYGQMFLALPFTVGDFGLTSVYQTLRKAFVTTLLGSVPLLMFIGNPVTLMFALALGTSGLRLAFSNLDFIATSPVNVRGLAKDLKPRIPGTRDVIVVNNRNKIRMSEPGQKNPECWLPDQRLLNPNCKGKTTEIPYEMDSVLSDLSYEETVNMKDITGLNRVEFSDKFDLGQTQPSMCKPRQGKEVHFLDKFGDSGPIAESEKWETCENQFRVSEKKYLRTRNKP